MYPIHELIVKVLSVLVELFQGAHGPAVLCEKSELFHSAARRFPSEVVGQMGVVHWHVVIRDVVAVGVVEVERRTGTATSQAETAYLVDNVN